MRDFISSGTLEIQHKKKHNRTVTWPVKPPDAKIIKSVSLLVD